MRKTRATSRVATSAGLGNAFLAARTEVSAPATPDFQAAALARRFGLSPAVAAATAALAYGVPDTWRAAR